MIKNKKTGRFQELPEKTIRYFPCFKRNYIKINQKWEPYARYLIEKKIRKLKKGEIVHHINRNKLDDRIENLQIKTIGEHISEHLKGKEKSPEHAKKCRLNRLGKKFTNEQRKNISIAVKKWWEKRKCIKQKQELVS